MKPKVVQVVKEGLGANVMFFGFTLLVFLLVPAAQSDISRV